MTFRTILASETTENAPVTQALMDAFRQNEVSVRTGAENAPRLQWKVLDGTAGAGTTTVSGLGNWQGGLMFATINSTNPATTFTLQFSLDGTTYFTGTSFAGKNSGDPDNVQITQFRYFSFPAGRLVSMGSSSTMGGTGVYTHMRFTRSTGSGSLNWFMHLQGGDAVF